MREDTGLPTVAVISHDPATRDALALITLNEGFGADVHQDANEFLAAAASDRPACVLLDLSGPEQSDLMLLRAIRDAVHPARVIVVSSRYNVPFAVAVVKAGAYDFIVKPFEARTVATRVREAMQASEAPASAAASVVRSRTFRGAERLTRREMDVLAEIVGGATNKEAAQVLGVSKRTIESHRASILEKLGIRNTADLVRHVLGEEI